LIIQAGKSVGSAKSKGISVSNALAERKLGLIDLFGGRSTYEGQSPKVNYFYLNRLKRLNEHFCYKGKLNEKICFLFRVDMGSDVFIINNKFIEGTKRKFDVRNCKLRYPIEENVSIEFKIDTEVELGKFSIKIPMFVSKISDDCLLGVDLLRKINLNNILNKNRIVIDM